MASSSRNLEPKLLHGFHLDVKFPPYVTNAVRVASDPPVVVWKTILEIGWLVGSIRVVVALL